MPNARDLAELSLVVNSVHDSIRSKDNLPNVIVPVRGNDPTNSGNSCNRVCLGNQFVSEGDCTVRIVARDEDDYVEGRLVQRETRLICKP